MTIPTAPTTTEGHAHGHDHSHAHAHTGTSRMALSATLHCLTGCAVGEITGLLVGTAAGMSASATIALSIVLAFSFGYLLSTLPLLKAGLAVRQALTVVLAADTLSIASMEIADNATMALIPGAMEAGLANPTFWWAMAVALTIAFGVAWPVNAALLRRGRGHALTHDFHGRAPAGGLRGPIPVPAPGTLAAVIVAFLVGGILASASGSPSDGPADGAPHESPAHAGR